MKSTFKEYHQYTEKEFKQLWENCLFVFDTNTLLNMYRYSRETVDVYFKVLNKLKQNKQLWIPYQVGYEFYERRIDVISEYEKSYDEIISILENIEIKYKNHPFLDLEDIKKKVKKGLSNVKKAIEKSKREHPNWLEKDDVLEQINEIFKENVGENYDTEKINKIKDEGAKRYDKKIPPGFKDIKKDEDKKFGDLILWYQMIDKAKESKKPIIFISEDVKEDWWLKKDGKKLMPLPQLKKEMKEKANVDFHIYTADRFLNRFLNLGETDGGRINERIIKEVKAIRELEDERRIMRKGNLMREDREFLSPRIFEKYSLEYISIFEMLESLMKEIDYSKINSIMKGDIKHMLYKIQYLRNKIMHGEFDRISFDRFYIYLKEILLFLEKIIHLEDIPPRLLLLIRECINQLEHINGRMRRYF